MMNSKTIYDLEKMKTKLKKYVDENRYIHTMGVMYTCAALAMVYDYDIQKAQVAGLLHDCAKCIPNDKKIKLCMKNHIPVSDVELANPILLHAKLGAYVAKKKYDISDEEILLAITYHTTGHVAMSTLEKIVFIADYIEPGRYKAKNLKTIRKTAFRDLDECVYMILRDTLSYLRTNPKAVDPTTSQAFAYYQKIHERNEVQQ